MASESTSPATSEQKENVWLNLLLNVFLPSIILMKMSKESRLGPENALILAALIPIGYGVYDYLKRRKINYFSIFGLVLVLVKGSFGLFKLDPMYFAVSEAVMPLLFGAGMLWTVRWKEPIAQKFLLNPQVLDVDRIRGALKTNGNEGLLRPLMVRTTLWYASTTLLSAVLNFVLTRIVVRTDPKIDQEAYVAETGQQNLYGWLVISLPLMAVTVFLFFWFLKQLSTITGLKTEEMLPGQEGENQEKDTGESVERS